MATAEELLASMVVSNDDAHIVINADRTITVPDILKPIAVQFDHNIETVIFDCPRYWDNHDFSKMSIYVNYQTPDGKTGRYPVTNVSIDSSDSTMIHFNWTISRNLTQVKGNISFLVCIYKTDSQGNEQQHWNSRLNREMQILEGLEFTNEDIIEQNPDIIESMLARLDALEDGSGSSTDLPADAMSANVYDPQGKRTDIFAYVDSKVAESGGNSGESTEEPAITDIEMVRAGSTIAITYTMDDDSTSVDTLTLDANGYPTNLNVDGTDVPITCTGFSEGG